MAKTYIPKAVHEIHALAVYMTKYHAIMRAAMIVIDPASGAVFDAMFEAVLAMDALRTTLDPMIDSVG